MTDYSRIRHEAKKKGPINTDAALPINIHPSREYVITRTIPVPYVRNARKVVGRYMLQPAIITVAAFNAGEACARADDIVFNTRNQIWGQGSKPWNSDGKLNWQLVETPPDIKPLVLR